RAAHRSAIVGDRRASSLGKVPVAQPEADRECAQVGRITLAKARRVHNGCSQVVAKATVDGVSSGGGIRAELATSVLEGLLEDGEFGRREVLASAEARHQRTL